MQVVIVGGGFAGIKSAIELSRRGFSSVTLISDQPYFLNRSTLHKLVRQDDESASIIQLDDLLAGYPSVKLVHDRLTSIDPERRQIRCKSKKFYYDKLILALGNITDFTSVKGSKKHSFDIEAISNLRRLRKHLVDSLNSSEETDEIYTIVGGGQTGVELAGSLASFVGQLKNNPNAKDSRITIGLIEKQARLLPNFSQTAGQQAQSRLEVLGVSVITGRTVNQIDKDTVTLDGHVLPSTTTLWATGTATHPFYQDNPDYFKLDNQGNVMVNSYLEAYQDVHVLGDNTNIHAVNSASNAIAMGAYIADYLTRLASGRSLRAFRPRRPLITIPIGDDWAYAQYRRIYSTGRFAYQLHRRQMIKNYRQIMPKNKALEAWNVYVSSQFD